MTQNKKTLLPEFTPDFERTPRDYEPFVGHECIESLKQLSSRIEGARWGHVNSTFEGGGVAEMLRSVIPLARSLGINADWYNITGTDPFFRVTKKFHNLLQGQGEGVTLEELYETYLEVISQNASRTMIASDLTVVHDPQPSALIAEGVIYGPALWRCHIDTSDPNRTLWKFLLPYINQYAGTIFTMPQFVGQGVKVPTYQIMPCIDPLAPKNSPYKTEDAQAVLSPLLNAHNIDADRPIVAAISRYDIHKNQATVLESFKKVCEAHKKGPKPVLIFLGNTATDDPEGGEMLEKLKDLADGHPDIYFWVNVEDNDRVVGSLMHLARCFVHISTREGFGLVVSEAMWQGTPVIGSTIGGITAQVIDGETGYLVDPMNKDKTALYMQKLLDDKELAMAMGEKAREHVRKNFLLPELLRRHFRLIEYYTSKERSVPEFRMDTISYKEFCNTGCVSHPDLV